MTTFRPLGPRVTLTASASALTPDRMRLRAASVYTISLADMGNSSNPFAELVGARPGLFVDHAEDVVLSQDETVLAVDLDLGPRVFSEQDGIARLDVELPDGAVFEDFAVADGNDLPLDRLFLGGVRDDDPALGHGLFREANDDNAILQRPDVHDGKLLPSFSRSDNRSTRILRSMKVATDSRRSVRPKQPSAPF